MIDATTTHFTYNTVGIVTTALFLVSLFCALITHLVPALRKVGVPTVFGILGAVICFVGMFVGMMLFMHNSSLGVTHSEASRITSHYATQTDEDQWLKKEYGIDAISRGYDGKTKTPTVTAKDADGDLSTYNIVYGDFETTGSRTYLNADLYLDGKPVKKIDAN